MYSVCRTSHGCLGLVFHLSVGMIVSPELQSVLLSLMIDKACLALCIKATTSFLAMQL